MISRLGVACQAPDVGTEELGRSVEAAARAIGLDVAPVSSAESAGRCDIVVALAFPAYYPWLAHVARDQVVSWFGEPLPRAGRRSMDGRLFRALPSGRLLDSLMAIPGIPDGLTRRLRLLRERAAWEREGARNLRGIVAWARRGRRVVVTSRPRATSLLQEGVQADVVPFGYRPEHAGPLSDPEFMRDIPVIFLGTLAEVPNRRTRLLEQLRDALAPEIGLVIAPGPVSGEDRNALLRRARIVVDVQRVPGNFAGLRILLAGAAGAAYVSEPMDDPHPFVAGVDHVAVPADGMARAVRDLLADEQRRCVIVRNLQQRMRDDLSMEASLERLLACVRGGTA